MTRFTSVLGLVLLICMVTGIAFAGGIPVTGKGDKQMVFHFDRLRDMQPTP
jgi:hypothetical protein